MKGYKYTTEQEAIQAVKDCNVFYAIPKNESDVTQNWCSYNFSELDGFWYIIFDESLEQILGQPIQITITENGIK